MKNYLSETDLEGLLPKIDSHFWSGETDWSKQKEKAGWILVNDLNDRGYNIRELQPRETLRDSGTTLTSTTTEDSIEDTINAMRFVYNVTVWTSGGQTLTLQGSNDDTTFSTVLTSSAITATGETSDTFENTYKYYKVKATITSGTLDYDAYLVETDFDMLLLYKWAELIMMDAFKTEGDQYYTRMMYFRNEYNNKLENMKIAQDTDLDGDVAGENNSDIIFRR